MIEFKPEIKDIALKIGKLIDDVYIDSSNDYSLILADDEMEYIKQLRSYGNQLQDVGVPIIHGRAELESHDERIRAEAKAEALKDAADRAAEWYQMMYGKSWTQVVSELRAAITQEQP
jgi:hypothetical protein